MSDTNILPFPTRVPLEERAYAANGLLAKINIALRAMTELHAELESLRTTLKARGDEISEV